MEINLCLKTTNTCYGLLLVWMCSCILQTHAQEVWIIDASVSVSVPFVLPFLIHHALQSPLVTDSYEVGCAIAFPMKGQTITKLKVHHLLPWMLRFLTSLERFSVCERSSMTSSCSFSRSWSSDKTWIIHAINSCACVRLHLRLCSLYKCDDEAGMTCTEGRD